MLHCSVTIDHFRPVGTPTPIIPVTSRLKKESSSCKIHYRQTGGFLVRRCVSAGGGGGARGEKLRPNAAYAHDPALIPEQARGNMAACTTTERGGWEGEGGRREEVEGGDPSSAALGSFRKAYRCVGDRSHSSSPVNGRCTAGGGGRAAPQG